MAELGGDGQSHNERSWGCLVEAMMDFGSHHIRLKLKAYVENTLSGL